MFISFLIASCGVGNFAYAQTPYVTTTQQQVKTVHLGWREVSLEDYTRLRHDLSLGIISAGLDQAADKPDRNTMDGAKRIGELAALEFDLAMLPAVDNLPVVENTSLQTEACVVPSGWHGRCPKGGWGGAVPATFDATWDGSIQNITQGRSYQLPILGDSTTLTPVLIPLPAPPVEMHYSPAENLEPLDVAALDKAEHSVDMVAYAFDDVAVAAELLALAKRGVAIRLYRDQQQYQGEQARAKKEPKADLMAQFMGLANISIKVKGSTALAHLKSYCVDCSTPGHGTVLRDGSANWSVQGERVQDNSLILVRDASLEAGFEANFAALWARANNQTIQ